MCQQCSDLYRTNRSLLLDLLKLHPEHADKIELVGSVDDRKTLYEYYNRSKVFCLTSPFESFGIAYAEAMYFGNYIVGNDGHSSFDLLSNDGQLGSKVAKNNVEELIVELELMMNDQNKLELLQKQIEDRARTHFSWRIIIEDLLAELSR